MNKKAEEEFAKLQKLFHEKSEYTANPSELLPRNGDSRKLNSPSLLGTQSIQTRNYKLESPAISKRMNDVISPDSHNHPLSQMRGIESTALNSLPRTSIHATKKMSIAVPRRRITGIDMNTIEDSYHSMDEFIQPPTMIMSNSEEDNPNATRYSVKMLGRTNDRILDCLESKAEAECKTMATLPRGVDIKTSQRTSLTGQHFSKKQSPIGQPYGLPNSITEESVGSEIINKNIETIKDENGHIYDIRDNAFEKYYHNINQSKPNDQLAATPVNRYTLMSDEQMEIPEKFILSSRQKISTETNESEQPTYQRVNTGHTTTSPINSNLRQKTKNSETTFAEAMGFNNIGKVKANMIESNYLPERRPSDEYKRLFFQRKLDNFHEYDDPLNSGNVLTKNDKVFDRFTESTKNKLHLEFSKDAQRTQAFKPQTVTAATPSKQSISGYYNRQYHRNDPKVTVKSQNIIKREPRRENSNRKTYSRDPFIKLRIDRIERLLSPINSYK